MSAGKAVAVANEFNAAPKVILLEGNVKPETRNFLNEAARKSGVTLLVGDLNGATEGQFSIETLPDGRKYVQADREVIFRNDPENWGNELENYINESIRRGEDVEFVTADGDTITITEDTAWKIGDMTDWTEKSFPTKMNMGTHIDELLQVSKHDGNEEAGDRSNKRFKPDSFDYRTAFFRDFNGDYYRVSISVGVMPNGKVAYNIGKNIKKRSFPDPRGSSSESQRRSNTKKASKNMIPQNEPVVKYSTKDDSNGKTQFQAALEKAGIDSSIFEDGENNAQLSIENGKGIKSGAFYVDKNIIAIDWRSEPAQITEAVALHEMTHSAESSKYFGEYKEFVKAQLGEDFEKQTREIARYYKENGKMLKRSEAEAEVVANYTRHNLLADKGAIEKFIKSNYGTARLLADGARDIINKVKSAFGIETVSKVEDGIRYLERALATRGTNSLTSAAGVQYNIDDGNYEQYGMTWTIGSGVLSNGELRAFSSKISEMKNNRYANYKMSNEGEYIFSVGNKLIYSDADYDNPTISKVITFNTDNETVIDFARECLYEYEQSGIDLQDAFEIIEIMYGEKFVTQTNFEDSRTNGRENTGRERTAGGKIDIRSGEDGSYSIENLSPEQVEAIKKVEESGDYKVSEFYKNSLQKEVITPAVKAGDAPERHKYKPISNEETYKNARAYVEATGFDEAKAEIELKFDEGIPLGSEEVGRAKYIFTQLQSEGKTSESVLFAERWNKSVTEGARALQALQILDRLTPEGKYLYAVRQAERKTKMNIFC